MKKYKGIFQLEVSKKCFKESYTLRTRIGMYIAALLGIIELKFTPHNTKIDKTN